MKAEADGAEEAVIKHREGRASPETCTCWARVRGQTPHNAASGDTWAALANYCVIKVFWGPQRVGGQAEEKAPNGPMGLEKVLK